MKREGYRDLVIWQKSMDLTERIYRESRSFPSDEKFGITSQLRKSTSSIPANIAEGFGRNSPRSFSYFLRIAMGSLHESETHICIAERLGYLDSTVAESLMTDTNELAKILFTFTKSVTSRI